MKKVWLTVLCAALPAAGAWAEGGDPCAAEAPTGQVKIGLLGGSGENGDGVSCPMVVQPDATMEQRGAPADSDAAAAASQAAGESNLEYSG
jgi:hypothetical protein